MSLRTLFLLMGLVTTALIAAVIYTKVLRPTPGQLTVGEQRALDRMCDVRCTDRAPEFAKIAKNSEELANLARQCVVDCRARRAAAPGSAP